MEQESSSHHKQTGALYSSSTFTSSITNHHDLSDLPLGAVLASRQRFSAPVDKLWLRVNGNCHTEHLSKIRSKNKGPYRRHFSLDSSAVFNLSEGQKVSVFTNSYRTEIQLNPSEWPSFRVLDAFLRLIAGKDIIHAEIIRLHCFVDVAETLVNLNKGFYPERIRKTVGYEPSIKTTSQSGSLSEIEFTTHFGAEKRRVFCLYDSANKHGLPEPCSRIERRDNTHSTALIRTYGDLLRLQVAKPFERTEFFKFGDTEQLEGKDKERADEFLAAVNLHGYRRAVGVFRKRDPKNFERAYKKVLSLREPLLPDLNVLFSDHFRRFAEAPYRKEDKQLIQSLASEYRRIRDQAEMREM